MNEIPRRNRLDQNTPEELAIRRAVNKVEEMGADARLTKAVILLMEAHDLVADYIDDVPYLERITGPADARTAQ